MPDLSTAGRRMASLGLTPTAPGEIERRARRRRHRRAGGLAAVATAAVVALVAGIVLTRPVRTITTTTHPAVTSTTTTPAPPRATGTVIAYGGAQLTLPTGWRAVAPAGAGTCRWEHTVWVGYPTGCSDVVLPSGDWVVVEAYDPTTQGPRFPSTVDGLPATVVTLQTTTGPGQPAFHAYQVPSLGVQLVVSGAGTQVLDTLSPSTWHVLRTWRARVATPAGWQTVHYGGFELQVPPSWRVDSTAYTVGCGDDDVFSTTPTVFTETLDVLYGCGGALFSTRPVPVTPSEDGIDRFSVELRSPVSANPPPAPALPVLTLVTPADPVAAVEYFTGAEELSFRLGLGTDPLVDEEILSSIRAG